MSKIFSLDSSECSFVFFVFLQPYNIKYTSEHTRCLTDACSTNLYNRKKWKERITTRACFSVFWLYQSQHAEMRIQPSGNGFNRFRDYPVFSRALNWKKAERLLLSTWQHSGKKPGSSREIASFLPGKVSETARPFLFLIHWTSKDSLRTVWF